MAPTLDPHRSPSPALESGPGVDAPDEPDLAGALRLLGVVWRDLARHAVPPDAGTGLAALACLDRSGPCRVSDVAAELRVSAPVASRHLTALEEAGHVARTPDPEDRRAHRLVVTDAGRTELRRVQRAFTAAIDAVTSDWDAGDVHALAGLLGRLHDDYAERADDARDAAATAARSADQEDR